MGPPSEHHVKQKSPQKISPECSRAPSEVEQVECSLPSYVLLNSPVVHGQREPARSPEIPASPTNQVEILISEGESLQTRAIRQHNGTNLSSSMPSATPTRPKPNNSSCKSAASDTKSVLASSSLVDEEDEEPVQQVQRSEFSQHDLEQEDEEDGDDVDDYSSDDEQRNPLHRADWSYVSKNRGTLWSWYACMRRYVTWVPGCNKHDNSFLCDYMIRVTLRIVLVFCLRLVVNKSLVAYINLTGSQDDGHEQECKDYLNQVLDFFGGSLPINILLALPALQWSSCRLFKTEYTRTARDAEDSKKKKKKKKRALLQKTFLLGFCEFLVIVQIPFLVFTFLKLFVLHNNVVHAVERCDKSMGPIAFLFFVMMQVLCVYTYFLRWWQIIVFHWLHEHLLYQRGFLRGKNRFKYDGSGFLQRYMSVWSSRSYQIQQIKVRIYQAAKEGHLKELRQAVEEAQVIGGVDFATTWYEPHCDSGKFADRLRIYGRCRRNPLHVAVVFDQLECVRFLVETASFDVNGYDKLEVFQMDMSSLYHYVFDFFFTWFARNMTIARTQNRDVFGNLGTLLTPLHVAVSLGHYEMAALLIQSGADSNACACSRHQRYCTSPLFWAISEECVDLLMLQGDANHLFVPGNGYFLTPYEAARLSGSFGIASRLQQFGGDMALTPLHDAAGRGVLEEVTFYLDHGANPNSLGENCVGLFRRTPLHWAAMRGHREVVRQLIRYGALVDVRDRSGRTPLAWASFFRRIECVEELLTAGADPNVKDCEGNPILSIVAASPASMILRSHEQRGQPNQPEHEILLVCHERMMTLWKNHHGELSVKHSLTGDTPLHVALMNDNEQASIAFVRNGLSLTVENDSGKRPIDVTTSTSIRYAVKKEAGYRDVMISYCHTHSHFAWKVRNALERAHFTTWIDQMDPTGITGGAVWRQEIAQAIENSTMMLCILCEHYPQSQWCMKELAYAKLADTPVLAIQCSEVEMNEELQMYLYTRQIIDFKETILAAHTMPKEALTGSRDTQACEFNAQVTTELPSQDSSSCDEKTAEQMDFWFQYDEVCFDQQMKLLLDGVHAEIQHRKLVRANAKRFSKTDLHNGHQQRSRRRLLRQATIRDASALAELLLTMDDGEQSEATRGIIRAFTSVDLTRLNETSGKHKDDRLFVFVSHGNCHQSFCQRLRNCLVTSKCNVSVVVDMGSLTSKSHLITCDVLVVVLSSSTVQSAIVADQLAFAEDHLKPIVPLLLSSVEVDAATRYTFSRSSHKVLHFNESLAFDQSIHALVKSLRSLAEQKREDMNKESDGISIEELKDEDIDEYIDDCDDDAASAASFASRECRHSTGSEKESHPHVRCRPRSRKHQLSWSPPRGGGHGRSQQSLNNSSLKSSPSLLMARLSPTDPRQVQHGDCARSASWNHDETGRPVLPESSSWAPLPIRIGAGNNLVASQANEDPVTTPSSPAAAVTRHHRTGHGSSRGSGGSKGSLV